MKRLLLSGLAGLLVLSTSGFAQQRVDTAGVIESKFMSIFPISIPDILDITGGGARAQGMGKAFFAVADDASAVSWNPAGLYGQEQPILGFSWGAFSPKGKYTILDQKYDKDDVFSGLTMLSFLAPIRIKGHPFVGSASYSRADDEYFISRAVYDTLVDYNPTDDDFEERLYRKESRGENYSGLDIISIGFGTRLYDDLSFGATANIYTHRGVSNQSFNEIMDGAYIPQRYGLQPLYLETGFLIIDTSAYTGVNFTIGFKYDVEKLSAGLVIKTPFALEQNTDRTVYVSTLINGDTVFAGTSQMHFDNIISKIDIPVQVGAGVAYRPNPNLLLALDFEVRPYSGSSLKMRDSLRIIPGEKDQEYYTEYDLQWKDVFVIRTGGEYLWQTGYRAFPVVPVRAGFGYIPIPAPGHDTEGRSKSLSAVSVSLGTGVRWAQIHLDAAYTYTVLDRELFGSLEEHKNNNSHFNFTFTGYF